MGFFDKLFKSKKVQEIVLCSPINGELCPASEIPDPTFAEAVLGPTVGFKPGEDGTVYSPCDGVVSQIFRTAHAVTITSTDGVELLIHVGINTVDLKGEGFQALVKDDEQVKKGQPLIKFDQAVIAAHNLSNMVPMVICNEADFAGVAYIDPKAVTTAETVCTITPKAE